MSAPPRVLVIEDEPDMLELLGDLLEDVGYTMIPAASAPEARTELRRAGFDAVVMDLLLGGNDIAAAWAFVDEVRGLAGPAPIGLMSGLSVRPEIVAEHGLAFALLKPFSTELLLDRLAAECSSLGPPSETELEAIGAYFRALEGGAWDQLGRLVTDDVVYHLPGDHPTHSRVVEGRDAFLAFSEQVFASYLEPRFEVAAVRQLPGGALARFRSRWRNLDDTGGEAEGAVFFELRGDHIARIGVRIDLAALAGASRGDLPPG